MAKFKTYSFVWNGEEYESDSMKDCILQYYKSRQRIFAAPDNFDEKYEKEKVAWEAYLKNHGKVVEIEVEGE